MNKKLDAGIMIQGAGFKMREARGRMQDARRTMNKMAFCLLSWIMRPASCIVFLKESDAGNFL